ncbi:MAG: aldehyde dehydrogenase family protein [Solirubrobacterales bacterium]|nr:aldehyde dehydrogenase family protein [Solirubrobacterales bacterium]
MWAGQDLQASCYIDGAWVEGQADETTRVVDPATEALLADMGFASVAQVEQAIAAARRAFEGGPWPAMTPLERSALLHRLTDLFQARRDEFVDHIIAETGSPTYLAQSAQVDAAIDTMRWFAEAARTGPTGGYERGLPLWHKPVTSASLLRMEPVGVVASITAYNYPLFLLARKLGGVLAAGCTTVVMPSERAPLSTWRFFQLVEEAGYPAGVANLVIGGRDAGVTLSTHRDVDMVSFTGSVAVGAAVMAQASGTTKKVVLELGGKSPTIILPGADVEACVAPTIMRMAWTTGQACGCTTRTFVPQEDYDAYVEGAGSFIGGMKVGDPRAEGTILGPLIRDDQRRSVEAYVERALADGGEILAGGGRPAEPVGYYMNPALIGGVGNESEIAQNELFGPVGVLMPYRTLDEAVAAANASRYGLNAAVWGPEDIAMQVAQRLRSGTVAINGGGGPRPDAPWGGPRESGVGREGGEDGFRDFFEVKHVHWPLAGPARPAPRPAPTEDTPEVD